MEGQGVGIHNINTIMGAEMSLYIQEKSPRLSLSIVEAVVVKEKGKLRTDYRGIYVYLVVPKVLSLLRKLDLGDPSPPYSQQAGFEHVTKVQFDTLKTMKQSILEPYRNSLW